MRGERVGELHFLSLRRLFHSVFVVLAYTFAISEMNRNRITKKEYCTSSLSCRDDLGWIISMAWLKYEKTIYGIRCEMRRNLRMQENWRKSNCKCNLGIIVMEMRKCFEYKFKCLDLLFSIISVSKKNIFTQQTICYRTHKNFLRNFSRKTFNRRKKTKTVNKIVGCQLIGMERLWLNDASQLLKLVCPQACYPVESKQTVKQHLWAWNRSVGIQSYVVS